MWPRRVGHLNLSRSAAGMDLRKHNNGSRLLAEALSRAYATIVFGVRSSVTYDLRGKKVYVAGHRGMVGSAIVRRLSRESCEIVTASRERADLRRQIEAEELLDAERPHAVFIAAARVGGIHANETYPADFLYDNLAIETNLIEGARRIGVEKLLYLGSSCIYPKLAPQPMAEEALLTGPLEPTNQWYAIAKIAGLKLCAAYRRQHGCDFISAMPSNIYGPNDNFSLLGGHVAPAIIAKAHAARVARAAALEVWGSGRPLREFLYVDDLADACIFLMKAYSDEGHVNVGTGTEVTIRELAELICRIVGLQADLVFNSSRPDGTPRKLLDTSKIHELGWRATTSLEQGLRVTYAWYVKHLKSARGG